MKSDAQTQSHGHVHGAMDRVVLSSQRGIWATKVSLVALLATAVLQMVIVVLTGSVALLADTIHNFGDAATALPLWAAFTLARRQPTRRFTYGYGRAEDLAGLLIVISILATGIIAGYISILRLFDPPEINFIWVMIGAELRLPHSVRHRQNIRMRNSSISAETAEEAAATRDA